MGRLTRNEIIGLAIAIDIFAILIGWAVVRRWWGALVGWATGGLVNWGIYIAWKNQQEEEHYRAQCPVLMQL